MTEIKGQEHIITRESRPVAPREDWTYFEAIMIGSSERNPENGEIYNRDRVTEESYPDWVFTCPEVETSSLEEVNNKRKGSVIYSALWGPLSASDLPVNCVFEVFLEALELGSELPKYEFGIAVQIWEEEGPTRTIELNKPAIFRSVSIDEEDRPYWELEPVPDHPERRYLVPIRKAA